MDIKWNSPIAVQDHNELHFGFCSSSIAHSITEIYFGAPPYGVNDIHSV